MQSKLSFAEVVSGVNQEQFEQKKRSKNLVLLGTKPDSENTKASDNRHVSKIAESLKVNMKFECQRIGEQNTEGKQLLRIECEPVKMKWVLLKMAKALKAY